MKKFWMSPRNHQRLWALQVELLALAIPMVGIDGSEPVTIGFMAGVMCYTILVSILPAYAFFGKSKLVFDTYPLDLALHLQEIGGLGRRARADLEEWGVQFDRDEQGWFVCGYDAPN